MNHFLFYIVFMTIPFLNKSCQNSDNTISLPNGISYWRSDATGYILKIEDGNTFSQFGSSSAGCVSILENLDSESLSDFSINQTSDNTLIITQLLTTGEISFYRLPQDEISCLDENLIVSIDPIVNYRHFWTFFNEYYVNFDINTIDWDVYKDLEEIATEENLYNLMENAITPLNDGHVSIQTNAGVIAPNYTSVINLLNEQLDVSQQVTNGDELDDLFIQKGNTIITQYLNNTVYSDENEKLFYGITSEGIGYINIVDMEDYATNTTSELEAVTVIMDEVMEAIQTNDVQKLIIDVRFNSGGYDNVALKIASYFFDQQRDVFTKKSRMGNEFGDESTISVIPNSENTFTGDIALLISPYTASAAEIFTLAMKTLPYTTIVGQPTNGAFSDILTHKLPNGTTINFSNQRYTDPDGTNFEGVGIKATPENTVPFLIASDYINNEDSGINRAINMLEN